ncbi:hypothetical protein IDM40_15470 [Nocardiopsis sp. HNM0947]|uniref:Integral membrane protein n=1 Tax=Nocardiopsis coralli TaxID=2772213 RepID=A0ABR9P8C0_9ACTN|nr:hypothetical protein [Nocardiopsis coralli]MBE3000099.1 hypothetical protein [Nocardiopsis coralli]
METGGPGHGHGHEAGTAVPGPGFRGVDGPVRETLPAALLRARSVMYLGGSVGLVLGAVSTVVLAVLGNGSEAYFPVPVLGPVVLVHGALTLLAARVLHRRLWSVPRFALHLQVFPGVLALAATCALGWIAVAEGSVLAGLGGLFSILYLVHSATVAGLMLRPTSWGHYPGYSRPGGGDPRPPG